MLPRRRPLRRRPLDRRSPAGRRPPLPPAAADAERLMKAGQYGRAAERFDSLAERAEARGRLAVAGELQLRAARCWIEVDDDTQADNCAEKAIHLFMDAHRPRRVQHVLPRVLAALERHGRHDDASRLRQEVAARFEGAEFKPQFGDAGARHAVLLPAKCGNCGAPLLPEEVAWSGRLTATCPYCGTVVKGDRE